MAADGVERARVRSVSDPAGLGRVLLEPGRVNTGDTWALVATPAAPAVGDEVLVAFEGGEPDGPVVIGSLRRDALELRFGDSRVVLGADGVVRIDDANGNAIALEPAGITVTAAAKVTITAGQVQVSAEAVTVAAGLSKFSGTVQCDTLIANSVVAASYTPGVGNTA